uniref:DDE_Tnp_1_7 domain-containing protein n=1 Tax=Steinernema glaseri TaxID=37863 RepID=A0A1I7YH47_9BILA
MAICPYPDSSYGLTSSFISFLDLLRSRFFGDYPNCLKAPRLFKLLDPVNTTYQNVRSVLAVY